MKQWLKSIFYTPKHSKPTDKNILQMIAPSIMGIALCMVCLADSSWAWFSSHIQTPPQTIASANFGVEVSIDGEQIDSSVSLAAGQSYKVALTATGTAEKFGGYCVVEGNGVSYYTAPLLSGGETLTFTLNPEQDTKYTFTAVWGKYSSTSDITDGCIIGQEQPDAGVETSVPLTDDTDTVEYVVQSGDTLWEIALAHDTAVAELTAYNGIDDPSSLQIGQTIKIPAEDLPTAPADSEQTQETESITTNDNTQ